MEIRDLTVADETAWRGLWQGFLAFYDTELAEGVTEATWARLMDARSPLQGRVAVADGQLIGFALHHPHLSTWQLAPDCYLEDLFVTAAARGTGAGRALIDDLISICRAKGYARLYWMADAANARARALYDSYTPTDGHLRYRIRITS